MDIVLFILVAGICFLAGRQSAPREEVPASDLTDKERKDLEYQRTLNQSLLTEVQQYRVLETRLKGELWDVKKELKKLNAKDDSNRGL